MNKLDLLMPEFKTALISLVVDAQEQGLDVDVESSFRNYVEQDRLYALGRTIKNPEGISPIKPMGNIVTNAKSGQSWHNYGLAADVVFRSNGNWDWSKGRDDYEKLANIAVSKGLEWGGYWHSKQAKSLGDIDHFQLTRGLNINNAFELASSSIRLNKVWDKVRELGA